MHAATTAAPTKSVFVDTRCHRVSGIAVRLRFRRQEGGVRGSSEGLGSAHYQQLWPKAPRGVVHGCTSPRRPQQRPTARRSASRACPCPPRTTTEFNCSINHYFRSPPLATDRPTLDSSPCAWSMSSKTRSASSPGRIASSVSRLFVSSFRDDGYCLTRLIDLIFQRVVLHAISVDSVGKRGNWSG